MLTRVHLPASPERSVQVAFAAGNENKVVGYPQKINQLIVLPVNEQRQSMINMRRRDRKPQNIQLPQALSQHHLHRCDRGRHLAGYMRHHKRSFRLSTKFRFVCLIWSSLAKSYRGRFRLASHDFGLTRMLLRAFVAHFGQHKIKPCGRCA